MWCLGWFRTCWKNHGGKQSVLCVTECFWCWHHWTGHGGEEVPPGTVITDSGNGLNGKGP